MSRRCRQRLPGMAGREPNDGGPRDAPRASEARRLQSRDGLPLGLPLLQIAYAISPDRLAWHWASRTTKHGSIVLNLFPLIGFTRLHRLVRSMIDPTVSAPPPARFFRFREERYWRGSPPIVGLAPKELVTSCVSTEELGAIFGGHAEYESAGGNQRYLGVWGNRKVAQFLRLLRERGAAIAIEEATPGEFRQRHRTQMWPSRR
jgi:hypothetical protein